MISRAYSARRASTATTQPNTQQCFNGNKRLFTKSMYTSSALELIKATYRKVLFCFGTPVQFIGAVRRTAPITVLSQ